MDQAMPQQEEQAPQEDAGSITKVAQDVGAGLAKLGQALDQSPAATDQDRQMMAQVLSGYTELVEKFLSQAPGQDPEAQAVPGAMSADGGPEGVPMGPQSRM